MRTRIPAASAAALIALALLVHPASAVAPTVRINTPGSQEVLGKSTPTITGDAQMSEGRILEVVASVSSAEGRPVPSAHRIAGDGRSSVSFSWSPSLPYNGHYSVTVRASGEDRPVDTNGNESSETSRRFAIEAPPAIPRDVKVRADQDSREVDVTWQLNKEPDMIGYQVQRSVDGSEWSVAGESDEGFYRDTRTASRGGKYSYRVIAIRRGANAEDGVASRPSEPASTTVPKPPGGDTTTNESPGEPDTGPSGDGDSTASGGGSGSTGSGGTSAGSGSSSPSRSPAISRSGRVDLSGFGSLLDQTRAPQAQTIPQPDAGFAQDLPFESRTITEPVVEGGEEFAVPEGGFNDASSNQADMLKFMAAGLLLTVILMHVLWLRSEVERVPLETVPSSGS